MLQPSSLSPVLFYQTTLPVADLQASPMCRNAMKVLQHAHHHGGIPLTKAIGNFHRKFVEWAAEDFEWPGYKPEDLYAVNKVLNEPDFQPLSVMHEVLIRTRLMRHYKGKAVLTKAGKAMLGHYGELQAICMDYMMASPFGADEQTNTLFWDIEHFLGVIGNRLGRWVKVEELAQWLVPVDLFKAPHWSTPGSEAALFAALHVVRPMAWLGLLDDGAEANSRAGLFRERLVKKTPLFDQFVKIVGPDIMGGHGVSVTVH